MDFINLPIVSGEELSIVSGLMYFGTVLCLPRLWGWMQVENWFWKG